MAVPVGIYKNSCENIARKTRFYKFQAKLRTQIIQPSDQAVIISMLCIRSGSIVVESGTGSGALTISLAQTVAPHGQVYTFEFNEDRVDKIHQDMKLLGVQTLVTATHGDACAENGFSIVKTGTADAVTAMVEASVPCAELQLLPHKNGV